MSWPVGNEPRRPAIPVNGDGPFRGPASGADGVIIALPRFKVADSQSRRSPPRDDSPSRAVARQRRPGPPLQRRQPCRRGSSPRLCHSIFSADETVDLGRDTGTPVSDDYTPATSVFTGTVGQVQIDVGAADADHFISAEERFHIAMARQ